MDSGRVAQAIFLLGVLAGMLVLLIAQELVPEREDPAVAQFQRIKDFTRSYFVRELSDQELVDRALHGMIDDLDPYSRYYDRSQAEQVRRETDGDFRGIGVIFRRPVQRGQVLFPLEGTPAWEAGLRVGDRFVRIDGEAIDGLSEEAFRAKLTPEGRATFTADVLGMDGEEREVVVTPRELVDPTVRHETVLEGDAGYLCIRSFSHQTAREFDEAVERLRAKGARSLVIDLRANYGGVLDAAIEIAQRFVEEGDIVSSEGRVERRVHSADGDAAHFAGLPTVVLVNGDSASASEVLAGALQDHRIAAVVGSPTYGKGMLQTIRSFPQFGSRAKVTSAYYYSPSRRNFERTADEDRDWGILPDLEVPIPEDTRRAIIGYLTRYDPPESLLDDLAEWEERDGVQLLSRAPSDPQLDAALALLRGEPPGPTEVD